MPFGWILDDNKLPHVPGTVILNEEAAQSSTLTGGLKHAKGDASIILVPQPSDDPNDPLNWSLSKKLSALFITILGTLFYASVFGPLLNASILIVASEYNVGFADVTKLTGYQTLVAGALGPFVSAISRKYGKRAMFLVSSLFALVGTIIASCATTYNVLTAARVIQGFSVTSYETLCYVIIADLFFVHERGLYSAIVSFLLSGVSNLVSVICGAITENLGWKYLFHLLIACCGLQLILQFLFVPETTYRRDRRYEIDRIVDYDLEDLAALEGKQHKESEHLEKGLDQESITVIPPKKTFWQEKAITGGCYTDDNLFQLAVAPFAVCLNPVVLFLVTFQGWSIALFVAIAYVLAQIFGLPPYLLSTSSIGNLSLGPFIGGALGVIILGPMNDPILKFMTRKNQGVYEPEYRLLLGVTGLAISAGVFGFGYVAEEGGSYYLTATLHGIILFGVMGATLSTSSYILDAYREMSSEIFIAGMMIKNFLFYGFSYFVNDWLTSSGPRTEFFVFGATSLGSMVGIPLIYIFGKKYRSIWYRQNLLKKLGLKTHAE